MKVRAHSGDFLNSVVDYLAQDLSKMMTRGDISSSDIPQDVRRLVIASRRVTDVGTEDEETRNLLNVVETFSSRVPYDDEPDLPSIRECLVLNTQ